MNFYIHFLRNTEHNFLIGCLQHVSKTPIENFFTDEIVMFEYQKLELTNKNEKDHDSLFSDRIGISLSPRFLLLL